MMANRQEMNDERLTLHSRISDMAQVSWWIERLSSRRTIPVSTQFAMNLCLEEVLSNIIQHGYSGQNQHSIAIQFASPRDDYFEFVVEDQAPPFNPVDAPELPALGPHDEGRIGGQGIRLLHRFADSLEYQELPTGNRLTIGFSTAKSALAKD